jgi:hypothetical protein
MKAFIPVVLPESAAGLMSGCGTPATIKRGQSQSALPLARAIAVAKEDLLRNGVGRDTWPRVVH